MFGACRKAEFPNEVVTSQLTVDDEFRCWNRCGFIGKQKLDKLVYFDPLGA